MANAIPIRQKTADPQRIPISGRAEMGDDFSPMELIFAPDETSGNSGKTAVWV